MRNDRAGVLSFYAIGEPAPGERKTVRFLKFLQKPVGQFLKVFGFPFKFLDMIEESSEWGFRREFSPLGTLRYVDRFTSQPRIQNIVPSHEKS